MFVMTTDYVREFCIAANAASDGIADLDYLNLANDQSEWLQAVYDNRVPADIAGKVVGASYLGGPAPAVIDTIIAAALAGAAPINYEHERN